jgi:hypothetical protein
MSTCAIPVLGAQFAPTFHRPFLRYFDGDAGAGAGDGAGNDDPGFPKDTPVKDMSAEQQAAYWKHQSRRHEARAGAYGGLTPEQVQKLQKDNQDLRSAQQTDADKAIEKAREEGREEGRNEFRPALFKERATNALQKALSGRVPDAGALLGLDVVSAFVKDGKVDQDAVKAWVEQNSEASSTTTQKKAIDLGQGKRPQVTDAAGDRGRGEAARRFAKKKQTTDS